MSALSSYDHDELDLRDHLVAVAHRRGAGYPEIAAEHGISVSRVRQIVSASLVNREREEWILLAHRDGEPWDEIATRWGISAKDAHRIYRAAVRRGSP